MRSPRGTVPLERALSKLGLTTRSEARGLILDGRVTIDGLPVREPTILVIPERIRITIDGRERTRPEPVTVALHKPRGVVTTRRDPGRRPTVYDLIRDVDAHVVPIGRLDFATSGLLLLTNDTRLADWLTDPANAVLRVYLVTVRGLVTDDERQLLERGVSDHPERPARTAESASDGARLRAQEVTIRKASSRESHLVMTLVEGKNREVRRLLSAVRHEVTRLRRVQIGGLEIGDLAPGAWRRLTARELERAFPGAPILTRNLRTRAPRR
jgi:23S rRNA pseudouridine2605 synthase